MPASKLELLIKTLRRQIIEYSKTNQVAAKKFQEMLEKTIAEYHERRKRLSSEEAGETQEQASEDIIRNATEQALRILQEMNENRESFRKVGLTFEEKAFYDILMSLRDQYNFEYGEDKNFGGVIVNSKCKALARKIKEIIDTKSSFADWLNNQIVRDQLKFDIKPCQQAKVPGEPNWRLSEYERLGNAARGATAIRPGNDCAFQRTERNAQC